MIILLLLVSSLMVSEKGYLYVPSKEMYLGADGHAVVFKNTPTAFVLSKTEGKNQFCVDDGCLEFHQNKIRLGSGDRFRFLYDSGLNMRIGGDDDMCWTVHGTSVGKSLCKSGESSQFFHWIPTHPNKNYLKLINNVYTDLMVPSGLDDADNIKEKHNSEVKNEIKAKDKDNSDLKSEIQEVKEKIIEDAKEELIEEIKRDLAEDVGHKDKPIKEHKVSTDHGRSKQDEAPSVSHKNDKGFLHDLADVFKEAVGNASKKEESKDQAPQQNSAIDPASSVPTINLKIGIPPTDEPNKAIVPKEVPDTANTASDKVDKEAPSATPSQDADDLDEEVPDSASPLETAIDPVEEADAPVTSEEIASTETNPTVVSEPDEAPKNIETVPSVQQIVQPDIEVSKAPPYTPPQIVINPPVASPINTTPPAVANPPIAHPTAVANANNIPSAVASPSNILPPTNQPISSPPLSQQPVLLKPSSVNNILLNVLPVTQTVHVTETKTVLVHSTITDKVQLTSTVVVTQTASPKPAKPKRPRARSKRAKKKLLPRMKSYMCTSELKCDERDDRMIMNSIFNDINTDFVGLLC